MPSLRYRAPALAAAAMLFGLGNAHASGFSVPEISIAGLGTSNAVVANPRILGAVPYNPSLAAFHAGTTLTGGLTLIHAEAEATTALPNTVKSVSFQGKDKVFIPNLSLTHQISEQLTLAINASVPLGLSTSYPAGTFSVLGANSPTKSQVEVVDISPSLAFKIDDSTSAAVGVDYYRVRKVAFDANAIQNKGDGDAWGWNISANHRTGRWTIGVSFRSHTEADISGSSTVPGPTVFGGTTATLDIPWRAQIGARFQINQSLALEGDISRTGWRSFEALNIKTTPAGTISSSNHWKDTNAYRLGGTYQLDANTELRFGYTFDKSSMPDAYYSARIADADRHLFSIGMARRLGHGWAVEAGYMLVRFKDKSFRSATAPISDPNGTFAYNGDYKTTVHLLGLGLSKRY